MSSDYAKHLLHIALLHVIILKFARRTANGRRVDLPPDTLGGAGRVKGLPQPLLLVEGERFFHIVGVEGV